MLLEKEIDIGPAEWQMWKNHPVTQKVLNALQDERSIIVQELAFGRTLEKPFQEVKETALASGKVQGLTIILEDLELVLQEQWEAAEERRKEAGEESSE